MSKATHDLNNALNAVTLALSAMDRPDCPLAMEAGAVVERLTTCLNAARAGNVVESAVALAIEEANQLAHRIVQESGEVSHP